MLTIAIAEDNAAEREGLIKQVALLRHKLLFAAVNGYDLLEQLLKLQKDKLPKLLLLDINMPRINGLIITIYCAFKYPNIKIIGVSSHTNEQLVTEILTEGAVAFITKYFLTPNSIVYKDNYGTTNVLQIAIDAVLQAQLFIDKLLVNDTTNIKLTPTTASIIAKNYKHLNAKQIEFAILNAAGLSIKDIAKLMSVSPNTVKDYNKILCKHFAVANHSQLALACFQHGIVKQAVYYDKTMEA
jgi:DNA-binding NarL/FixJ family response regulator